MPSLYRVHSFRQAYGIINLSFNLLKNKSKSDLNDLNDLNCRIVNLWFLCCSRIAGSTFNFQKDFASRCSIMNKFPRFLLLFSSAVYFLLCIVSALEFNAELHRVVVAFFILYGCLVVVRYAIIFFAFVMGRFERCQEAFSSQPLVTVIVPAFNEEDVIEQCLSSLLLLDYPHYEVIVVDDGSSDKTADIARRFSHDNCQIPITVIRQTNSSKANALNMGVMHGNGEFFMCIDSDSTISSDAITTGLVHFKDPSVGAVGGFVDINNTRTLLSKLQALEYVVGLSFTRAGLSYFNMVTVVPGPMGMFRGSALRQVGGYSSNRSCFAEDAELTVRLLSQGWKVRGEKKMIAHTEAPENLYALLRQRYRWKRGIFQAFSSNIAAVSRMKGLRRLGLTSILVFDSFLFDVINFGITLFGVTSFLVLGEYQIILWFFLLLTTLDLVVLLCATLGRGSLFRNILLFAFQRFTYSYILQLWGVFALIDEWRVAPMAWDKLDRIGGINEEGQL